MPVDDNAFLLAAHGGRPGRVPARQLHRVEEPVLVRDLRARRQARRSTASAAATASSGWRSTGCCRRWDRPTRRSRNIREAISRGRSEFAEFLDDIRLDREPAAGLPEARAALAVVESLRAFGLSWPARPVEATRPMIITRSPLRITLGGGGTDLPSYYREHGGFLIAAAIDKYVYVTVMRPFTPGIYLKYSQLEHVDARRRRAASDHPRGVQAARRSARRRSRSRRWPTFRPAPASARRAASRPRCSRRSTRIERRLHQPASWRSWPATSRSTGWRTDRQAGSSTSRRMAA